MQHTLWQKCHRHLGGIEKTDLAVLEPYYASVPPPGRDRNDAVQQPGHRLAISMTGNGQSVAADGRDKSDSAP
jgi:hypothetical protein